jgi:glutathione S-transferase
MSYIVFGDRRSGAFAVESALAEAGVKYEFHLVSLEKNEQKSPAFLALNPSGKMPALKLPSGEIVTESAAILLTIADRFPQAGLIPPHATFARAEAYRWIAFMASEIYPMVEIVDYPDRFAPAGAEAEALKARAIARIRERMLLVEAAIAGPWLLAHEFCAADIYAAMFSRWSVGKDWRGKHLPKLNALVEKLAARPRIAPVWQKHFGAG